MSGVANQFNGDLTEAVNSLFNLPETIEKFMWNSRTNERNENRGLSSIPVDILDTPKEYIFYMDVPGLSKTEIQVQFTCLSLNPKSSFF